MSAVNIDLAGCLPDDHGTAALVARVWRPDIGGPAVAAIREGRVLDVTMAFPTVRDLCERPHPAEALRAVQGEEIGVLDAILANTIPDSRDPEKPYFLAPIDLQAIKAA